MEFGSEKKIRVFKAEETVYQDAGLNEAGENEKSVCPEQRE